jgi:hypothetical protein
MKVNATKDTDERTVYRAVERLGGRGAVVNELSVSYACPSLDVYAVLRDLAERGLVERVGAGVRIVKDFSESCTPTVQPEAAPIPAPQARTRTRKLQFPTLSRDPRLAALEMAARIKHQIENLGDDGSMGVSVLKRSLHAYRHSAAWEAAIHLLVATKQATVANRSLTLLPTVKDNLPDPYNPKGKKAKRPRRKRTPTAWFETNRQKMDLGQHDRFHLDLTENEDAVEPWSEGAYWIEKSQSK